VRWEVRGSNPTASNIFYTSINNQPMRDTWRPWIGPRVLIPFANNRTRVSSRFANINQPLLATSPWYGRTVLPRQTVRTVRTGTVSIKIFACLAWRTDRDIFSIRRPFDKVNIPPESGRRDGRNGTVFVAFRAL
jgi:hypothetical protein